MRILFLALFVLTVLPLPVMAATVNVQPLYDIVNQVLQELLQGLALAVSGWLMFIFHKYITPWIGTQMETKARDSLNIALANGVAIAMNKVTGAEKANSSIEVKNSIAAWAAQYAIDHTPQAVARFGLSPEQLALKALAYVPPAPTVLDLTGALPSNSQVQTGSLPPVTN